MKKILLFNGRFGDREHIFIGAYSMADAARILETATPHGMRGAYHEIREYFNKGAWGNFMTGITRERGAWIRNKHSDEPVRIVDADGKRIEEKKHGKGE